MEWPERFYDLKRGEGCPICAEGRPDETPHGIRFFGGELTDAYLHRGGIQRGLAHVYFRGRHVVEPTELDQRESAQFWRELLIAGAAIERVFGPVKMNYDILGNSVPHLHVHLVPRYAVDPGPNGPSHFPVRIRRRSRTSKSVLTLHGFGPTWRGAVDRLCRRDVSPSRLAQEGHHTAVHAK